MRLYTFVLFTILVTSYATISLAFDVDGDGKEGLAESIHALQVAAGLNPAPPINCTAPDEVLSLGRCWKDRNLGANRVATSSIDSEGYGDLYQWGRPRDGHQHRTSGLETTNSVYDDPAHGDFITEPDDPGDWREPQNDALWQSLGGINNPCPQGFRLPTIEEFAAEWQSWGSGNRNAEGAFASTLKLTTGGLRSSVDGMLQYPNNGYYWSSTIIGGNTVDVLFFSDSWASSNSGGVRATGMSVRCIKDLDYSSIVQTGEPLGEACTSGSDCLSGNCIDGVCCNSSCGSICESCDFPGSEGICGFIPFGNDPANECSPGTCDGSGVCIDTCTDQIKNLDETDIDCGGATCAARCVSGQDCAISSDCESNFCDAGFCF